MTRMRVGDEVRERVDVVVVDLAVAIVDEVLDAADVDAGGLHDALDRVDDLGRRRVALDVQAGLGGFEHAGGAERLAARGLADVRRAEIEGLAGEVDLDGVEILAAEGLDAGDVTAACGNELLHQGDVVEAELRACRPGRRLRAPRGCRSGRCPHRCRRRSA